MTRARDVADVQENLGGAVPPFAAGKNKIINGDFRFNQRNFTSATTYGTYGFDRFYLEASGGTFTYSPQTFTPGTAPVSGYEAINFARLVTASQSTNTNYAAINQPIEDVRTFAGQTVTVSFWAKASTGTPNIGISLEQNFGAGGSSTVPTSATVKTITSAWARYSFTLSVPSISGKTVGTSSFLNLYLFTSVGTSVSAAGFAAVGLQNVTIDFWGVQLEAGSVATPFQTSTGSIEGELAACQRYYEKNNGSIFLTASNGGFGNSYGGQISYKITKRVIPTVTIFSAASQSGTSGSATWYPPGTVATADFESQEITQFSFRASGTSTYNLVIFSFTASAEL